MVPVLNYFLPLYNKSYSYLVKDTDSNHHSSQICQTNTRKNKSRTQHQLLFHVHKPTQTSENLTWKETKKQQQQKKEGISVSVSKRKYRTGESPASVCEWASWSVQQTPGENGRAGNLPPFTKQSKKKKRGRKNRRGKKERGRKRPDTVEPAAALSFRFSALEFHWEIREHQQKLQKNASIKKSFYWQRRRLNESREPEQGVWFEVGGVKHTPVCWQTSRESEIQSVSHNSSSCSNYLN